MPNTAKFPTAIATNADLLIATNRGTCTLNGTITSSATTILTSVQSPAIVAPCAISIDDEIILIASATTTQLNVASGGRGFDGTTAASHNNAATVNANVIAWSHNQVIAEIEAMETFMGTNGSNLGSVGLLSQLFDWVQTPGGSLAVGSNLVTLSPVPPGVNGSDANHYVYVSGGTGAAETCLITGGTAVAGASSGTIIFSCANTHTGAWTVATASGGIREAIISCNGNATVWLAPNKTNLVSGTNGLVIDKHNLTIIGSGLSSVIKARDNAALNEIVNITDGDGLRLFNFTIDGNRDNAGTLPSGATAIGAGEDGVGGCSHVIFQGLQIFHSTQTGIGIHDTSSDILIQNCWIHDNGGVLNSSGAGQGIFAYWSSETNPAPLGIRIVNNFIVSNHNTITNAGPSCAIAIQGQDIHIEGNYCKNNYNDGGQIVMAHPASGPATIIGNTILLTTTALVQHTSGIESDVNGGVVISGNNIIGHNDGAGIAIEGNASGPSGGIGASDTIIIGNNLHSTFAGGGGAGIVLLDAGGIVRGTVIVGNRIAVTGPSGTGIFIDSATKITNIVGNNFADTITPIIDNSATGAETSGNWPSSAANFLFRGSISSGAGVSMRNGQSATVTGSTNISFINLPSDTSAGILGAGCTVTLIPGIGSTWRLITGGNIGAAFTPVPGVPVTCTSDGTLFWAQ